MPIPELLDLPPDVTHFYRYGSTKHLEWLKPVILEHRIYMPTAKELNDPRECKPPFVPLNHQELRRHLMKVFRTGHPRATLPDLATARGEIDWLLVTTSAEQQLAHLTDVFYERTEKSRVFSMSGRWNNMAMWAKYADDHRGYCLKFARVPPFDIAHPVLYDASFRIDLRSPEVQVVFAWAFCKHPDWRNEEEFRVVLPPSLQPNPWYRVGPDGLTRIFLGKEMRDEERAQIKRWASDRVPPLTVMKVVFNRFRQELTLASD